MDYPLHSASTSNAFSESDFLTSFNHTLSLHTHHATNAHANLDADAGVVLSSSPQSSNPLSGGEGEVPVADVSSTLFLGDLSVYCTEKDIRKLFRPFGLIEAIRLKRGSSNSTNLSYGFIKFQTRNNAELAMLQLNGIMFLGRALRIGWAEGKSPNKVKVAKSTSLGSLTLPSSSANTAQVHVSFISKQVDVLISEATLRSLFSLYGEVVDVAIKKSQFDKNLHIQNGYGFVHYPLTVDGIHAAINAVNSLHQVTIDRVTYDCSVSHALESVLGASNNNTNEELSNVVPSLAHTVSPPQLSLPMKSASVDYDVINNNINTLTSSSGGVGGGGRRDGPGRKLSSRSFDQGMNFTSNNNSVPAPFYPSPQMPMSFPPPGYHHHLATVSPPSMIQPAHMGFVAPPLPPPPSLFPLGGHNSSGGNNSIGSSSPLTDLYLSSTTSPALGGATSSNSSSSKFSSGRAVGGGGVQQQALPLYYPPLHPPLPIQPQPQQQQQHQYTPHLYQQPQHHNRYTFNNFYAQNIGLSQQQKQQTSSSSPRNNNINYSQQKKNIDGRGFY